MLSKLSIFICTSILFLTSALFADTTYVSGDVSGVWEAYGSPYLVTGEIHVPTDSSLRIMPGCSVIFQGYYKFCIDTNAILKAVGTEIDSIIFTARDTLEGHHGLRFFNSSDECTLMYCKITFGIALGFTFDGLGGGIFCRYSNINIIRCKIEKNGANDRGGGICCYHSNPRIINNDIVGNIGYLIGGGIGCSVSDPIIINNKITNNLASTYGGGGILCSDSNPIITNNIISGNSAGTGGSGGSGGGIYCGNHSSPIIENNQLSNNTAGAGGGIYCSSDGYRIIKNNKISNNQASGSGGGICSTCSLLYIANNVISSNFAGFRGGGISCSSSDLIIINNTICNNQAESFGGGIDSGTDVDILIFNTILNDNTAIYGNEIYGYCSGIICYSLVNREDCDVPYFDWGIGNVDSDPFFTDSLYHLGEDSPCIDAGAGTTYFSIIHSFFYAPEDDFEGDSRPLGYGWDIGADESPYSYLSEYKRNLPEKLAISAYPNPFNSTVKIAIGGALNLTPLLYETSVQLEIFNINGKLMEEYFQPIQSSIHPIIHTPYCWTPEPSLPSGIYFIRVNVGNQNICKKIMYMK
ncbi:right-handed parallel beta-helix repeat-containing protein [bacterium]|nr:right-handed parallel beta-helix repeat-containing protein [bacterium]